MGSETVWIVQKRFVLFRKTDFALFYLLNWLFLTEIQAFVLSMFVVIKSLEDVGQNDLLLLLYWYCEVVLAFILIWIFFGFCLW